TTPTGGELYAAYQGVATSRSVSGLPTNGSTIYVRLLSWINGGWHINSYTYMAATTTPTPTPTPPPTPTPTTPLPSSITSPTPGSTLTSSSVTFTWTAGTGVTDRYLTVGTTPTGGELYAAYQGAATSRTISGLPRNGSTIYVRLLSWINGNWQINSYTYTSS